jgi:hypothetical protein
MTGCGGDVAAAPGTIASAHIAGTNKTFLIDREPGK